MKNLILCSFAALAAFPLFAQDPTQPPVPGQMPQTAPAVSTNPEFVQFTTMNHDFGNIKQNVPPSYTFEFKNVGDRDITLVNVQASCGCTTPNWKGGVYKPGESGQITATYNAASEGFFTKSITVTTSEGVVSLIISGTVLAPAAFDEWKAKQDADAAAKNKTKPATAKKPVKKPGKPAAKPKTSSEADKPKSTAKKPS